MTPSIQTYTGREVFPLDLKPSDICINDIAHALSMKCRFTGHMLDFYSIAQHSLQTVNAMEWLKGAALTPQELLAGLLHDASEAYFPDFAKPIKGNFYVQPKDWQMVQFKQVETEVQEVVAIRFGLDTNCFEDQLVKQADYAMLRMEQRCLMKQVDWWSLPDAPELPWDVEGIEWRTAERLFLERFHAAR